VHELLNELGLTSEQICTRVRKMIKERNEKDGVRKVFTS
ncbi:MAG: hypothetical protein K0Q56_2403, partial [Sporolactobacillus laevolacticus]|nr:hypothetical protein [Sporolactobacillus laevolacticus]